MEVANEIFFCEPQNDFSSPNSFEFVDSSMKVTEEQVDVRKKEEENKESQEIPKEKISNRTLRRNRGIRRTPATRTTIS